MHTFNPLGGSGSQISEFKTSVIYRVISKITKASQRNSVSKRRKKKHKNKPQSSLACTQTGSELIWLPKIVTVGFAFIIFWLTMASALLRKLFGLVLARLFLIKKPLIY